MTIHIDASIYVEQIIDGTESNFCEDLTGKILKTLDDAIEASLKYHFKNPVSNRVLEVRACIGGNAREFHKKAGTYSDKIERAIADLSDPNTLVVEVAHQPNIFPYGGYFKKIVLGHLIAEKIRRNYDLNVVELFGIVDQDLASPKWFRNTYLPDINANDGFLVLKAPVSKKSIDAMYTIPKPSADLIDKWKSNLETWLVSNSRTLNKIYKEEHNELLLDRDKMHILRGRLKHIFELMDYSLSRSTSLTEFNSYFISKLTNSFWDYPMLFYEYHSTQKCFSEEYLNLSNRYVKYHDAFKRYYHYLNDHDISLNFNVPPVNQAPFWIHCDCGAKVEGLLIEKSGNICLSTSKCLKCGKKLQSTSLEDLLNNSGSSLEAISPRAVSRPIIVANGIMPSIFVSGIGAVGFEMISRGIANELDVELPPYVIWQSKDVYQGIAQKVAELTRKKLDGSNDKKDVKIYERCLNAMNLMPSIIDYLTNFGFEGTRKMWEEHLLSGGALSDENLIDDDLLNI